MKIVSTRRAISPNKPSPSPSPPLPQRAAPTISGEMRGTPWAEHGNILIYSGGDKTVFKSYIDLLDDASMWFQEQLKEPSALGGSGGAYGDCAYIHMNDTAQELSYFLCAIHHGMRNKSLESSSDFDSLAAILRLATRYRASQLRAQAFMIFQEYYPSTLLKFNQTIISTPHWLPDPIRVINLARDTSAFALLPAAMAILANNTSAGEVFGVQLHPTFPVRVPRYELNPVNAPAFGLVKELNNISIVTFLKSIRNIATNCRQFPEALPRCLRTAPVGYFFPSGSANAPSVCAKTLKEIADNFFHKHSELENPVGFLKFVGDVREIKFPKTKICRRCRQEFREQLEQSQRSWWDRLPSTLGFSGWEDNRLQDLSETE